VFRLYVSYIIRFVIGKTIFNEGVHKLSPQYENAIIYMAIMCRISLYAINQQVAMKIF